MILQEKNLMIDENSIGQNWKKIELEKKLKKKIKINNFFTSIKIFYKKNDDRMRKKYLDLKITS